MKRLLARSYSFIAVVTLLLGCNGLKAQQRLALQIECADSPCSDTGIPASTPIKVKVVIKNVSQQDLRLATVVSNEQAELSFDFKVTRVDGSVVNEMAGFHARKSERHITSRQMVILKPGEEKTEMADLSRLFDMQQPGVYLVVATRGRKDADGLASITSNSLKITVTP